MYFSLLFSKRGWSMLEIAWDCLIGAGQNLNHFWPVEQSKYKDGFPGVVYSKCNGKVHWQGCGCITDPFISMSRHKLFHALVKCFPTMLVMSINGRVGKSTQFNINRLTFHHWVPECHNRAEQGIVCMKVKFDSNKPRIVDTWLWSHFRFQSFPWNRHTMKGIHFHWLNEKVNLPDFDGVREY